MAWFSRYHGPMNERGNREAKNQQTIVMGPISISALRELGREVGPNYTTAPLQEGALPGRLPEFARIKTTSYFTGLSRGKIYVGIKEGCCAKAFSLAERTSQRSTPMPALSACLSLISHLAQIDGGGRNADKS